MGTSKNQPSPRTPNWRAAQLAYANPAITIDRAVQEIWRAATNQESGDITALLGDSAVAECYTFASAQPNRTGAVEAISRHLAETGQSSLGLVIAQRAIAQSYGSPDPVRAFTSCLFAEAGNYLVSRDLPGFVGQGGRATSVTQAIELKSQIRNRIAARVESVPTPRAAALRDRWADYVATVVDRLRGQEGER